MKLAQSPPAYSRPSAGPVLKQGNMSPLPKDTSQNADYYYRAQQSPLQTSQSSNEANANLRQRPTPMASLAASAQTTKFMGRRTSDVDKSGGMSPQLKKQALLFKEFLNKKQSKSPQNISTAT